MLSLPSPTSRFVSWLCSLWVHCDFFRLLQFGVFALCGPHCPGFYTNTVLVLFAPIPSRLTPSGGHSLFPGRHRSDKTSVSISWSSASLGQPSACSLGLQVCVCGLLVFVLLSFKTELVLALTQMFVFGMNFFISFSVLHTRVQRPFPDAAVWTHFRSWGSKSRRKPLSSFKGSPFCSTHPFCTCSAPGDELSTHKVCDHLIES